MSNLSPGTVVAWDHALNADLLYSPAATAQVVTYTAVASAVQLFNAKVLAFANANRQLSNFWSTDISSLLTALRTDFGMSPIPGHSPPAPTGTLSDNSKRQWQAFVNEDSHIPAQAASWTTAQQAYKAAFDALVAVFTAWNNTIAAYQDTQFSLDAAMQNLLGHIATDCSFTPPTPTPPPPPPSPPPPAPPQQQGQQQNAMNLTTTNGAYVSVTIDNSTTTNPVVAFASYTDTQPNAPSAFVAPGSTTLSLTTAVATQVVPAPPDGINRNTNRILITNNDTVFHTVIVRQVSANGVIEVLFEQKLSAGDALEFSDPPGKWFVLLGGVAPVPANAVIGPMVIQEVDAGFSDLVQLVDLNRTLLGSLSPSGLTLAGVELRLKDPSVPAAVTVSPSNAGIDNLAIVFVTGAAGLYIGEQNQDGQAALFLGLPNEQQVALTLTPPQKVFTTFGGLLWGSGLGNFVIGFNTALPNTAGNTLMIRGQDTARSGNEDGGDIVLCGGAGIGSGIAGDIILCHDPITGLPIGRLLLDNWQNAASVATVKATIPIYKADGTFLGYVPVYTTMA